MLEIYVSVACRGKIFIYLVGTTPRHINVNRNTNGEVENGFTQVTCVLEQRGLNVMQ